MVDIILIWAKNMSVLICNLDDDIMSLYIEY